MWTKIVQHRVAFLVGMLLIAVVPAVLQQMASLAVAEAGVILFGAIMLGLFLAGLSAVNASRPATFVVRDGGFTTPPDIDLVLKAAIATVFSVAVARDAMGVRVGFGFHPDRFEIVLLTVPLLFMPLVWYRVLGRFGAVLRPDGLLDRQPFGSVFVPWEAGPTAEPTAAGVKLRFAHPELVRRRGFRPGTIIRTGADRGFTAWAINLYATGPAYRPTIGTDQGLLLLEPR